MRIVIDGTPIAKKRPRFARKGNFVSTYNSQDKEMKAVRAMAARQVTETLSGAISVILTFIMPIPKSATKKKKEMIYSGTMLHTKKPDLDNLEKFILDCLNGIAFDDDSQIVNMTSTKVYGDEPRTEIVIIEAQPTG